ncbi:MAG TPA: hypothetical protein VFO42_00055 [Sphingomicrobium sp.]|nr:hypothetical protein [Sphingomicrobium sp.]
MSAEARRSALAAIIRDQQIASQEQLAAQLGKAGFEVTQATVSRDLEALGAIRGKRGGQAAYLIPDGIVSRLDRIIAEWVVAAEAAGNLLVVRTRPGSAHVVAAALDEAALQEVAGTIAGDDTLFVALRDGTDPAAVAVRLGGKALPAGEASR